MKHPAPTEPAMAPRISLDPENFNQLATTRNGVCLYNRHDIYIGQSIARYGEFSRLEWDFLSQLLVPGDIVIEVGANIGAHTIEIARRVGSRGRVIAFEPQRLVFQVLCANVALNSLDNVDCYLAAAGAEKGMIVVPELDPRRRNNFGGLSLHAQHPGRQVDQVPLDVLQSLPRVKLVKIDVEGMEREVISGAEALIGKFRPFLYVENDRMEKSESLMRAVDALGYRMFWHQPPLYNPRNLRGDSQNIFGNIVSRNMFCLPRERTVKVEGLAEITDFTAHPGLRMAGNVPEQPNEPP